jgi:type VI secretion system protein VasD
MNSRHLRVSAWFVAGLLALGLVGCSRKPTTVAPPPPSPTKFQVTMSCSPTINQDNQGRALSVVVQFYCLKDKAEFSKLTFDAVAGNRSEKELLGADFLAKTEVVALPGGYQNLTLDLAPGAKYVGMVAFFRRHDPNYWRLLTSVDAITPAETKKQAKQREKQGQPKPNPAFTLRVEDCGLAFPSLKMEPIPGQPENAKPDCGKQR